MDDEQKTARIRELNDLFRKTSSTLVGVTGQNRVVVTRGIAELGQEKVFAIFQQVRAFDDFNGDNDPHDEHDFGGFVFEGTEVFWKIDYYDHDMEQAAEHPEDPAQTVRVLTIMLATEY